jgi:hypothetical protein
VLGRGMIGDLLGWGEAINITLDSRIPFLDDKYSDYYIELPKMDDIKKEDLPEEYHDLWDICCIFRTKMKDMEEVIRMQAVKNPVALSLASEVRKTVAQNDVVHDTLDRKGELLQLQNYFKRMAQKAAQSAEEKMIIAAIKINAPAEVITTMKDTAGISDARLSELRTQVQAN